jgi:hypothetical protein
MEAATVTGVPDRTHEQRMEALDRGNEVRKRRSHLKLDLKAGRAKVDRIILDPPEWATSMRIVDALAAVPGLGRVKVGRLIVRCRISHSKTLGGLSERQRTELVAQVQTRGWLS